MHDVGSCIEPEVESADGLYRPIPYGAEDVDWRAGAGVRCHDCFVEPGGFHHSGCDVGQCPRCGGQLITCDCPPPAG
jgi:hypothetical protein